MKKLIFSVIVCLILLGCGGDNASVRSIKPSIAIFGDSVTVGIYCDTWPNCKDLFLNPSPVMVIESKLNISIAIDDLSVGGETTSMVLSGAGTYQGVPIPLKHPPLLTWAQNTSKDIVVLRIGGADAVLGIDPDVTIANINNMVTILRTLNKKIILVGITGVIDGWKGCSNGIFDRAVIINRKIAELAYAKEIPFVDVRAIAYDKNDIIDGLHPGRRYSDLQSQSIADTINTLLSSYQ